MQDHKKLLEALIEKPSGYDIDVLDNSMLPDNLKKRKTIKFVVKPPTMEVMARSAVILMRIPQHLQKNENIDLMEVLNYRREIAEIFCVIAHGKNTDYPKWYVDFILNNVSGKELFTLFQETSLKMQSDFFLHSFQIAKESNPMMMKERKT